jgi:hypothetical protein
VKVAARFAFSVSLVHLVINELRILIGLNAPSILALIALPSFRNNPRLGFYNFLAMNV